MFFCCCFDTGGLAIDSNGLFFQKSGASDFRIRDFDIIGCIFGSILCENEFYYYVNNIFDDYLNENFYDNDIYLFIFLIFIFILCDVILEIMSTNSHNNDCPLQSAAQQDVILNETQSASQSGPIVAAITVIVTTKHDSNECLIVTRYDGTRKNGLTTIVIITANNDNCNNVDKLWINGIFQTFLNEYLFIENGLLLLSIISFFIFPLLIFYKWIFFYHDNGTSGLIIDDLNGYYFYSYQLLKLIIFITIYGAFFIVLFKYGTTLFTFIHFPTILGSQQQLEQGESKQKKQKKTNGNNNNGINNNNRQ